VGVRKADVGLCGWQRKVVFVELGWFVSRERGEFPHRGSDGGRNRKSRRQSDIAKRNCHLADEGELKYEERNCTRSSEPPPTCPTTFCRICNKRLSKPVRRRNVPQFARCACRQFRSVARLNDALKRYRSSRRTMGRL